MGNKWVKALFLKWFLGLLKPMELPMLQIDMPQYGNNFHTLYASYPLFLTPLYEMFLFYR